MKKYLVMTILFLSIGMACTCKADVFTNDSGEGDNLWNTGANWDGKARPGANADAEFSDSNGSLCKIMPGNNFLCRGVFVGMGIPTELDMLGGTLHCSWLSVGRGSDPNTNGYFKMTGGEVTTVEFAVPYAGGTNRNYMPIGRAEIFGGTINVTGAAFQMGDRIYFKYGGGYGTLYMKAGAKIVIDANIVNSVAGDLYNGYITADPCALIVLDANTVRTTLTVADACSTQASRPGPNSWATVVYTLTPGSQTTSLSWTSATNKFREYLYFSKDANLVATANPSVKIEPNSASPRSVGSLDLNNTYYWQIQTNIGGVTRAGQVWRFRIANYLLVDNFDGYTGTWTSSGGASSSVVSNAGLMYSPDGNSLKITVGAGQSGSVSRTPAGSDWTSKNVYGLYIDVYGDPNNDANSRLTVTLNDTATVTYPGSLKDESVGGNRATWKIPLQNFGLSMSNITKLAIGVNNTLGVSGCKVNVDEIKLVPAGCVTKPDCDLDNDCKVGMSDLAILVSNWLTSGLGFPE